MADISTMLRRFLPLGGNRKTPVTIFANRVLSVTRIGNQEADRVFVCFTGIKQKMGGVGSEEFVGSTANATSSALYVHDLTRSWYNAFDTALLADILMPLLAGKEVITIGNSMGGFGAILATSFLPARTAIAFAPQFSVHPEIVPHETRWREYTSGITAFRHEDLSAAFRSGARIYTINGNADELRWSRFPHGPELEHLVIDDSGHDPALAVKGAGAMSELLAACCDKRPVRPIIENAGLPVRPVLQGSPDIPDAIR